MKAVIGKDLVLLHYLSITVISVNHNLKDEMIIIIVILLATSLVFVDNITTVTIK